MCGRDWALAEQASKGYLGPEGDIGFFEALKPIIFGERQFGERVSGIQTPGGTGALRLAFELIARARPGARIWVGNPTWPNHPPILGAAGLEAVGGLGGATGPVVLVVVAVGSALTVGYGLRLWWGAFATKPAVLPASAVEHPDGTATTTPISAATAGAPGTPATVRPSSPVLVAPALVLAVLGLVVALVPGYGEGLLRPYSETFTHAPGAHPGHLTLWAGLTPTLLVTAAVLASKPLDRLSSCCCTAFETVVPSAVISRDSPVIVACTTGSIAALAPRALSAALSRNERPTDEASAVYARSIFACNAC